MTRKTGELGRAVFLSALGRPYLFFPSSPLFYWRATSPFVQMTLTEVAPPLALAVGPCTDVSNRNTAASGQ